MKLTVAIIVAALAVLLGPVVWQFATYKPQSVPSSGLPWQIETLPGGELNFPPDYPKMPGEPPRVQPSKKVAAHWDEQGNRIEK